MSEEVWKDIQGWEGYYQVSNLGGIRSLDRYVKNGKLLCKGKLISTWDGRYKNVNLCRDSKITTYRVHRLVAQEFVPNPDNKPEVNHIDGNKQNNEDVNLEWCTASENREHSSAVLGNNRGEKSGRALLRAIEVLEIKTLLAVSGLSAREIGELFGVSHHVIFGIKHGKTWAWLEEKGV